MGHGLTNLGYGHWPGGGELATIGLPVFKIKIKKFKIKNMNHTQAMLEAPVSRLFWRYTLPTIASMLVTGIYVTIDGMFVGHFLGETGLAGIMLAYPVGALLYAVGALIGMGAGALDRKSVV